MIMNGFLACAISFVIFSMTIPDNVFDKTWHAAGDGEGDQFVLYKDDLGEVRAIWQHHGAVVYVDQSIIYEVRISAHTLHFNNGVGVLGDEDMVVEDFALTYSAADTAFISQDNLKSYKILSERPIIYSKFGWLLSLEDLKANSLTAVDFE